MQVHAIFCSIFKFSRTIKMVGSDGFSNIRLFNQYSLIFKYENLDHKNPRFLNVQQNIQLF